MSVGVNDRVMNALPLPVLTIGASGAVTHANAAAEAFFDMSLRVMQRQKLSDFIPFGSPVMALVEDVRQRGSSVSEHRVDIGSPRLGPERIVDVFASPMGDAGEDVIVMLQERTIADKMDRQLTHRGAARSITALGAMLAHEIKNPLSGIRGAAQLLEQSANDEDRQLTRLICDETDRIVKLVERMELFGEERPSERGPINVHGVLDHVKAGSRRTAWAARRGRAWSGPGNCPGGRGRRCTGAASPVRRAAGTAREGLPGTAPRRGRSAVPPYLP